MNSEISLILLLILILHVSIAIFTWVDNRYRPLMLKFSQMESDSEKLYSIGLQYQDIVEVPHEFLESPHSVIIKEAQRVELRLMIEACLVTFAGVIPSSIIALMYG